jgi:hypothetical protein
LAVVGLILGILAFIPVFCDLIKWVVRTLLKSF